LREWPKNVPPTIAYPNIPLPELLANAAKKYPQNKALIFSGRTMTYRQLDDLCDRFAASLPSLNVKKGDRLALLLPNLPQFLICYYGAMRAGAIIVPYNPFHKERELEFQLKDSGAETIVTLDTSLSLVISLRERTGLRTIVTTTPSDDFEGLSKAEKDETERRALSQQGDTFPLRNLLEEHKERPPRTMIDPRIDPALLQYTGGTTGIPKAAVLTHRNLVVNAVQFGSWLSTLRDGSEVVLAALPLFHIFGMTTAMNMPISRGETMVLVSRFEPLEVLQTIQGNAVTFFPGVPTMFIALMNHARIAEFNLKSIRLCISGGASLPVQIIQKFEPFIGGKLVEGYGLTEASPVTHCNPVDSPEKIRAGSIGMPLPDTDARIVDIETGMRELPLNEPGELVVRGPQVMSEYWDYREETEATLRGDWLSTGDVARMDEDGYFYIVDRKKDMINVSGLKVWPKEIEEILYEHPAVKEAAVVGVPDPYRGEAVKAYIALKDGFKEKVSVDEIIQFCRKRISAYKAPTFVEFLNEIPKSSTGKILRRTLRKGE